MPICASIGRVKELHRPEVYLPALENQSQPVIERQVPIQSRSQTLMDKRIYLVVLLPEDLRMVRVGTYPLDSEKKRMLESEDIGVDSRVRFESHSLPLFHQPFQSALRFKRRRTLGKTYISTGRLYLLLETIPQLHAPVNEGDESILIKIHVGHRGKGGLAGKNIHVTVIHTHLTSLNCDKGQTFKAIDQ